MANRDRRISDLEKDTGGGDNIRVYVNWSTEPGLVLDDDAGEYVTEKEWKRRHPKDRLIIVTYEDMSGDDE